MADPIRGLISAFRQVRSGLAAKFNTAPVRYKSFSSPTAAEFDEWVARRAHHPAKEAILNLLANESLLPEKFTLADVGCGPGVFAAMLEKNSALRNRVQYTAFDVSENSLAY